MTYIVVGLMSFKYNIYTRDRVRQTSHSNNDKNQSGPKQARTGMKLTYFTGSAFHSTFLFGSAAVIIFVIYLCFCWLFNLRFAGISIQFMVGVYRLVGCDAMRCDVPKPTLTAEMFNVEKLGKFI